jgi:hypothetical protein
MNILRFPTEVLETIFRKVPFEYNGSVRLVCHQWRFLLDSTVASCAFWIDGYRTELPAIVSTLLNFRNLRRLELFILMEMPNEIWEKLNGLTKLETLRIDADFARPGDRLVINSWSDRPELFIPSLRSVILTGYIALLPGIGRLDTLVTLDVEFQCRSIGMPSIDHMKSLNSLAIHQTSISEDVVRGWARLSALRVLKLIRCNTLTDEIVAQLVYVPNLHILDLSESSSVTDAGIATFVNFRQLHLLDLRFTAVTDRGISVLKTIPTLKFLKYYKCESF